QAEDGIRYSSVTGVQTCALPISEEFSSKLHPSEVIFEDDFCVIAWSKGKYGKGKLSRQDFARASHVVMRPAIAAQSLETYYLERSEERRVGNECSSRWMADS